MKHPLKGKIIQCAAQGCTSEVAWGSREWTKKWSSLWTEEIKQCLSACSSLCSLEIKDGYYKGNKHYKDRKIIQLEMDL